jgi:hypothetical protein
MLNPVLSPSVDPSPALAASAAEAGEHAVALVSVGGLALLLGVALLLVPLLPRVRGAEAEPRRS